MQWHVMQLLLITWQYGLQGQSVRDKYIIIIKILLKLLL